MIQYHLLPFSCSIADLSLLRVQPYLKVMIPKAMAKVQKQERTPEVTRPFFMQRMWRMRAQR
jgi:hypothetical protein